MSLHKKTIAIDGCNLFAYPHEWQVPAATEKAAFESVSLSRKNLDFIYIGFPWATLIDLLNEDIPKKLELIDALKSLKQELVLNNSKQIATVSQHINTDRWMIIFKACGITDLFWSHATSKIRQIEDIRIHPFPLFPAQTAVLDEKVDINSRRHYMANFIGAHTPKLYLSNVRRNIFSDTNKFPDLLVIERNSWHFDRIVYDQQIRGKKPRNSQIIAERKNKQEYLDAIRNSIFTLCPTGSGPNSIRIYEALSLGSIPIILTEELRLPEGDEIWKKTCIFEQDNEEGYRRAMKRCREMNETEIHQRRKNTQILYDKVKPSAYYDLIKKSLLNVRPTL
jgi:hypothetical protein